MLPASAGKVKAGMVHSVSGCTRGVQVKLWDPLRTRATPERFRGVFTTRCYTNTRLPYLTLHTHNDFLWIIVELHRNIVSIIVKVGKSNTGMESNSFLILSHFSFFPGSGIPPNTVPLPALHPCPRDSPPPDSGMEFGDVSFPSTAL